jgi:hypothetical protein
MSPVLQAVAFSLAALVVGGLITRYFSTRRRLIVAIPSAFDLVRVSKIAQTRVQIQFDGNTIERLWVVRIVLRNCGNRDIEESMVRSPIVVTISDPMNAIDLECVYQSSSNEISTSILDSHTIEFTPVFLRRRSSAAYQILVIGNLNQPLDPACIECDLGTIVDTSTKCITMFDKVPAITRLTQDHKLFVVNSLLPALLISSVLATMIGCYLILKPILFPVFDLPLISLPEEHMQIGIALVITGFFYSVPTYALWRRWRYTSLFSSSKKRKKR